MTNTTESVSETERERVERILTEFGMLDLDGPLHSWRCARTETRNCTHKEDLITALSEQPAPDDGPDMYQLCMQDFLFREVEDLIENRWPNLEVVEMAVKEPNVKNYMIVTRE